MRTPLKSAVATVFLLAAAAVSSAAEVDNPLYKNWAKFKPGTTITMANVADFNGTKIESEQITTLVSVDADKVVIEMTYIQNGKSVPGGNLEIAAKMPTVDLPPTPQNVPAATVKSTTETKVSEEEVEVLGKKIKCKLTTTTDSATGSVTKFWTSDEVPGQMVKSESTFGGDLKSSASGVIKSMTLK